jgi:hypothetical protein
MHAALESFMSSKDDGCFMIGHSSVLARFSGKLVLFDPVWGHQPYGSLWKLIPEQVSADEVLSEAHCFVSHEHEDHFHPPLLKKLNRPLQIMDGRADFAMLFNLHSIHIFQTPPYEWVPFDEGLECYFVPHPTNKVDSSVFVRSADFCVYHGSDNFLTSEALERIRKDIPRVDVAFLPFSYVSWWPFLQVDITDKFRQSEIERMNGKHLNLALDFVEIIKPKAAVPFGASIYYNDGFDHILNQHLVNQTPLGPQMLAADYLLVHDGVLGFFMQQNRVWLPTMVMQALGGPRLPKIDTKVDLSRYDFGWLYAKVFSLGFSIPSHRVLINGLAIDFESIPTHTTSFDFDKEEFHKWATRKASIEDIIGTRRFEFRRSPDVYNPKVFDFVRSL